MKLPDTPQPGSPPTPAVWYRQAVDMLRRLSARVSALESMLKAAATSRAIGANVPFRLGGFIDTGPAAKIRVAPGLVNNAVPTISGSSLVAVPTPAITVTGSSGVVFLKVTVDVAGTITDVIADSAASLPADTAASGGTPAYKHRLLGTWTSSGGAFTSVTSIVNANQTMVMCGGSAIWGSA